MDYQHGYIYMIRNKMEIEIPLTREFFKEIVECIFFTPSKEIPLKARITFKLFEIFIVAPSAILTLIKCDYYYRHEKDSKIKKYNNIIKR